jgi:hypothetical protein
MFRRANRSACQAELAQTKLSQQQPRGTPTHMPRVLHQVVCLVRRQHVLPQGGLFQVLLEPREAQQRAAAPPLHALPTRPEPARAEPPPDGAVHRAQEDALALHRELVGRAAVVGNVQADLQTGQGFRVLGFEISRVCCWTVPFIVRRKMLWLSTGSSSDVPPW